jgi:predicted ATPase/DNA-binding winged helix-turn-helix (wHTH) protein
MAVNTERCRITLLGALLLHQGERRVDKFQSRQTAEVLAYLAYRRAAAPDVPFSRERLGAIIWPHKDQARDNLKTALSSVRRLLEPPGVPSGAVLVTTPNHVHFRADAVQTDVMAFESALKAAKHARTSEQKIVSLQQAISVYGGEFVPDCYSDWAAEERLRLSQSFQDAAEELARLLVSETSDTLVLQPRDVAAASATHDTGTYLPLALDRFVARQSEMGELTRVLCRNLSRLAVVTGLGGIGKTRLAVEFGKEWAAANGGGAVFVPLTDVATVESALVLVARSLRRAGRRVDEDTLDGVAAAFGTAPVLLILDDIDRLATATVAEGQVTLGHQGDDNAVSARHGLIRTISDLIRALLQDVSSLQCLCTSRIGLNFPGAAIVALAPLITTDARVTDAQTLLTNPSVQLYTARAQERLSDFQVTPRMAHSVGALCRFLEGVPLALELAAGWVRTLPPRRFLEEIANRLDTPPSAQDGIPDHHKSLRAALRASHDLLPPASQRLLAVASVFVGGWTYEAICAVASFSGEKDQRLVGAAMETLLSASLISRTNSSDGSEADEERYGMLETVREFAEELLSPPEREALRRYHASVYAGLAERIHSRTQGFTLGVRQGDLDIEHANLSAAMRFCLQHNERTLSLRFVAALGEYWLATGRVGEGLRAAEAAIAAVARSGTSGELGEAYLRALHISGLLARHAGDLAAADDRYRELLKKGRAAGISNFMAQALLGLANVAWNRQDIKGVRRLCKKCLAVLTSDSDPCYRARALENLANCASIEESYTEAQSLYKQAAEVYAALHDEDRLGRLLYNQAKSADRAGIERAALDGYRESLEVARRHGNLLRSLYSVEGIANIAAQRGDWYEAVVLLAATAHLRQEFGAPVPPDIVDKRKAAVAGAFDILTSEVCSTAVRQGEGLDWESLVSRATEYDPPAASSGEPIGQGDDQLSGHA